VIWLGAIEPPEFQGQLLYMPPLFSFSRAPIRWDLTRLQLLIFTALWISFLPNLAHLRMFAVSPAVADAWARLPFVFTGWLYAFTLLLFFLWFTSFLWRGVWLKVWFAICIIVASAQGYYSLFLGIRFDSGMLLNMMQTHPAEALELVTGRSLLWLAFVGVLPALLLVRVRLVIIQRWQQTLRSTLAMLLIPLLLLALGVFFQYQTMASARRNQTVQFKAPAPVNLVAAGISVAKAKLKTPVGLAGVGEDAHPMHPEPKPRVFVFVLGETARSSNQQLSGYARDTNAHMVAERVVSFPDTESCGTATAHSVPCMFSGMTREQFDLSKANSQENLLDVLRHAGVQVLWLDNDAGCKGVCDRVETVDLTYSKHPVHCSEPGNCYDAILLDGLEERLSKTQKDIFVVLHLKGSHGPAYFKRYPPEFEKFKPACQSNELTQCSQESLVNAYDNSLVYTDHILGEVVMMLKRLEPKFATLMMYASDHGESLGEKGLYLHGLPYALAPLEQTRVPMLAWFSPTFLKMESWDAQCPPKQSQKNRKHEDIYSTVLGLMEVATKAYHPERDLFLTCEKDEGVSSKEASKVATKK
jgi:lipid A ethanolaminephosphotransferase